MPMMIIIIEYCFPLRLHIFSLPYHFLMRILHQVVSCKDVTPGPIFKFGGLAGL